jgi:antitoxin ChpS
MIKSVPPGLTRRRAVSREAPGRRAKTAATPRRGLPEGVIALADLAREIGMDPKAARARFRRHRAAFAAKGLRPKSERGAWVFDARLRDRIIGALRGQPPMRMAFTGRLRRVGGSVMVAIAPPLLDALGLDAGAAVELSLDAGRLVVRPIGRPRYTLDELLARCNPSAPLPREDREWLNSPPVGRELI